MVRFYTQTPMGVELILLFVDGQPLVFEVKRQHSQYFFSPLTSWKDNAYAASFTLQKVKGQWEAIGVQDRDLIDQAIEEVKKRWV